MSSEEKNIQDALLLVASSVRLMMGLSIEILYLVRRAKNEGGQELKASLNEIERIASKSVFDLLNEVETKRCNIGLIPEQVRTIPKRKRTIEDD